MRFPLRAIATGVFAALCTTGTLAQIDPNDRGLGSKLGIEQLNNSGQVGTVTLFARGVDTLVVLQMEGAGPRPEPAHIHRGQSCDAIDPKPAYPLAPVINGHSRTLVHVPESRLLSGNYAVNIHAQGNPAHYLACGSLYR